MNGTTRPNYIDRLAEYCRQSGYPCQILNDALWVEENRMLFPLGPASQPYVISDDDAQQLLSRSRNAVLVRCTGGFSPESTTGEWYCVICRSLMPIEQCSVNTRKQLRKGLRQCVAKKVDAKYVAHNAYDVHVAACRRYGQGPETKERFAARILAAQDFSDVIDFWAVFHGDTVVGYVQTYLFGDVEAGHSSMAMHPDYFHYYSSHALIYTMNEYYLREKSFPYVCNGYRTLRHPSDIYDFLITRFGYERAYLDLRVYYKPWLARVMSLPKVARYVLARCSAKFAALNTLHEARTTNRG